LSMSHDVYVLLVCLLGALLLFPLTAAFNFKKWLRGRHFSSYRGTAAATKTVNILVLVALLLPVGIRPPFVGCLLEVLFAALVINVAAFINWFMFAVTDTSMHIHILTEFYRAGVVTKEELFKLYRKDVIVQTRVKRLLAIGQLKLLDGNLRLAGRAVLAGAEVCKLFRFVLGIPVRPPVEILADAEPRT
jgi:hypothetical protein